MTLKSYLLLSGGTLLAGYLVTTQPDVSPNQRSNLPRGTTPRRETNVDIQEQATRLQTRGRAEVEYSEPSRNPFRFVTRQPARPPAVVREPVQPPVSIVEPSAPPPIRLSGVASEGGIRRAFLVTLQGVIEVREGDTVPPDYRVSRVEENAVELATPDGTARRLVLRP